MKPQQQTYLSKNKKHFLVKSKIDHEDHDGEIERYYSDDPQMIVSQYDDGSKDYLRIELNKFYQLKDYDMYIYPYSIEKEWNGLKCISFFIHEDGPIIDNDNILSSGYNDDYGFEIDRLSESLVECKYNDIIRFIFQEDLIVYTTKEELSTILRGKKWKNK